MSKSQASPAAFSSLFSCQGLASSGQLSHTSPTPSPSVSTWWALGVKGQLSISLRIPGQREAEINLTFSVGLSLSLLYLLSVCLSQSAFPLSTHSHPITWFQSHPLFFSFLSPSFSCLFLSLSSILPLPPILSFPSPSLPFSPSRKKNRHRTVIIYIVITVIPNEVPVGILLFRVRDVGAVVAAVAPRVKIGVLLQGVGD